MSSSDVTVKLFPATTVSEAGVCAEALNAGQKAAAAARKVRRLSDGLRCSNFGIGHQSGDLRSANNSQRLSLVKARTE
ncbi:MAG: hypothetical protein AB7V13_24510 [Pseudorhodoplanes sp.]